MNTNADTNAATTPSFVAALVTAAITVGVFTAAWLYLHSRKDLNRVFQPRTELAPEGKRPPPLPRNIIGYWRTVFSVPDQDVIVANGVDAYLFIRFLKVFGIQMLVPYVILTFAICVPISVYSPNSGQIGLNKLSFGNVPASNQARHVGHLLVALILMGWTMYLLWREYNHFVEIRQQWLSSSQHMSLARTRTIALSNLPDNLNSESSIREHGGVVSRLTGPLGPRPSNVTEGTVVANGSHTPEDDSTSGGIRQVWTTKKVKPIEGVWEDRDAECARLEAGSSKLAKLANKNQLKGKTPEKTGQYDTENANGYIADRFVLPKKRPTWKQGFLGLIGKKMDLETSPAFIAEKNAELEKLRADIGSLEPGNAAFVRFGSQTEAHAFARLISSTDKKNRLIGTQVEVVPEDIEWSNISMSAYQRKIRTIISWSLTIGLIIIWAIPVAFVGIVSNVDTLCSKASWLAWICTNSTVKGIIKGVLPPALLAVLFMLLPIVLRIWVKLQGEILRSQIELKLFSRFWLFQVIHGFLIVTVASGLISALSNIDEMAGQVPTLLAEKLPNASIFFLTFILVSTFTAAAKAYSRAIPTAMFALSHILAGNTPRKVFMKKYKMDQFMWATTWPPICLLIVICVVYSVIQPVITLLTMVAFIFLYAAHKYLLFWTTDQPDSLETGGMFYIKALRTVFVGLYLEGICLAGLFFLLPDGNDSSKRAKAGLACGVIMVIMIVAVAALQIYIDWFRFKKDYLVYAHSSTTVKHSLSKTGLEKNGQAPTQPDEEHANAGPEHGNTTGLHEQAFDHPALWKKQPTIWLAEDPLGIGKFESARINDAGVESSIEYATMTEKGKVDVSRGPPDEAWYGGYTAQ